MDKIEEVLFRRRQGIVLDETQENVEEGIFNVVLVSLMELNNLGYKVSEKGVCELFNGKYTTASLKKKVSDVIKLIVKKKGDRGYNVMYPNFPNELPDMSVSETLQNTHYLGVPFKLIREFLKDNQLADGESFVGFPVDSPIYSKEESTQSVEYEEIKLYTREEALNEYLNILESLLTRTVVLSHFDKEDVVTLLNYVGESGLDKLFKERKIIIKNKETLVELINFIFTSNWNVDATALLKTPTDVLRYLAMKSSEDGSGQLHRDTEFNVLNSAEKRFIYTILDNQLGKEDEYKQKKNRKLWRRVFTVNKWRNRDKKRYKNLDRYVGIVFNSYKWESFGTKKERLKGKLREEADRVVDNRRYVVDSKQLSQLIDDIVALYQTKPGYYARELGELCYLTAKLFRRYFNKVLYGFEAVAYKVDTKVLIQARNYFLNVFNENVPRGVFVDGSFTTFSKVEFDNVGIRLNYNVEEILDVIESAIIQNYALSNNDDLGIVLPIPEGYKDIAMTTSERGKSSGSKILFSGSTMYLEKEIDYIRAYITWKNYSNGKRVDVDLSAVLYDESMSEIDSVCYVNDRKWGKKANKIMIAHSGDIVDAPKGALECVDMDMKSLLADGVRYIAITVHNYTGESFKELHERGSEPRVGIEGININQNLTRARRGTTADSSKLIQEVNVMNCVDLHSTGTWETVCVIDLLEMKYIWIDSSVKYNGGINNVRTTEKEGNQLLKYFVNREYTSVYDVLKWNALARGIYSNIPLSEDEIAVLKESGVKVTQYEDPNSDTFVLDADTLLSEYV